LEEITPKLDHLRAEKQFYLEYQKTESELERLSRLVVSYDYYRHQKRLNRSDADNLAREARLNEWVIKADTLNHEMMVLKEDKQAAADRWKSKSADEGGAINVLEQLVKDYTTQLVQLESDHHGKEESASMEMSTLATLKASNVEV
jgi:structural maintenance of chromosome 2